MWKRVSKLFRRPSITIPDASKLLEGEARKVDIGDPAAGGRQVILCRVDGVVHALDAECPHEGGRIQPGPLVEGRYALCPLHSYRFDPKNGRPVGVNCASARTYPVEEEGGKLSLYL